MTLLLAANTHDGIVMMSDGLCRRLSASGTSAVLASDQQKIFPFEKRSIAIAHHGQNILKGRPVSEIIAEIEATSAALTSIREIAEGIQQSLDAAVRETLQELHAQGVTDGYGFWIGGYGNKDESSSLYEVFWAPGGNKGEFTEMPVLAEGGDGKRFTQAVRGKHPSFNFTEDDAKAWSLVKWSDYIERLYKVAQKEPGAGDIFGGKVWKLWITSTGNKWTKK